MNTVKFLSELKKRLANIISDYRENVKSLDQSRLTERPSENSWSIIECLDHLVITGKLYIPQFEDAVRNEQYGPPTRTFTRGLIGRFAAGSMRPKKHKIPFKMKTFKELEPMRKDWDIAVTKEAFESQIKTLEEVIDRALAINVGKARITTALGSKIKLKMGDALDFVLAHIERHMLQMEKILQQISR